MKKPKRKKASKPAAGTGTSKRQMIIDLCSRVPGATLAEVMKATGWQAHSCHGALTTIGAQGSKAEGQVRVYRLPKAAAAKGGAQ